MVWRRDLCAGLDLPLIDLENEMAERAAKGMGITIKPLIISGDEVNFCKDDYPPQCWPITDTLFMARELHRPENKTQLIDNEAYLHGWSEKVFSSIDTRKMQKATKKKFKQSCVSF